MESDQPVRIAEAAQYMLDGCERDCESFVDRRDDGTVYLIDFDAAMRDVPRGSEDTLTLRCACALWYAAIGAVDPTLLSDMLAEAPRPLFRRWISAQYIASGYVSRQMVEAMTVVELATGIGAES